MTDVCTTEASRWTRTTESTQVATSYLDGHYYGIAVSRCGRHLAISSNLADDKVTEHRLQVFELAGGKDPILLHKLTFLTDYPQDWLRHLSFDAEVKGEPVLAGVTASSCMLLTFALRDKRLTQFEAEISFSDSPGHQAATLTTRGNSLWASASDNKINRVVLK